MRTLAGHSDDVRIIHCINKGDSRNDRTQNNYTKY